MIRLSIGTKIPPPPTPPTLPNAAPKNPIMDPNTIFHPNFSSYIHSIKQKQKRVVKVMSSSITNKQKKKRKEKIKPEKATILSKHNYLTKCKK